MDNIERYRAIVQRELEKIAATHYANGDYQRELVLDREHDRYLLMTLGWDGNKRIYYVVVHIDIIDGKLWIQENRTNIEIDQNLMQSGVPADHIVLGLLPPTARQYSEFAVA